MKKVLCVLLIVSLLLCFTACSKKPDGRYNIESMRMGETSITADELKESGMEMYIVFNGDGTGTLGIAAGEDSDGQSFTWAENKLTTEDGEEIAFTFDGTSVTISEAGTTIVFK